jgi:hypothetical protein
MSFSLSHTFSLQENWSTRGKNRSLLEVRRVGEGGWEHGGEVSQTLYAHMNKCKKYK